MDKLYWLGFAKKDVKRRFRREVIHLPCRRRFWTDSPAALALDLFSLKENRVLPKGTRLV